MTRNGPGKIEAATRPDRAGGEGEEIVVVAVGLDGGVPCVPNGVRNDYFVRSLRFDGLCVVIDSVQQVPCPPSAFGFFDFEAPAVGNRIQLEAVIFVLPPDIEYPHSDFAALPVNPDGGEFFGHSSDVVVPEGVFSVVPSSCIFEEPVGNAREHSCPVETRSFVACTGI